MKGETEKASLWSKGQHGGSKRKSEKTKKNPSNDQGAHGLERNCSWSWVSSCLTSRPRCVKSRGVRLDEQREAEAQINRQMQNIDPQFTPGLRKHPILLRPWLPTAPLRGSEPSSQNALETVGNNTTNREEDGPNRSQIGRAHV